MPRLLLTILMVACYFFVPAQDTKNYLFSSLNARSGLNSNTILSVQQDSTGFIWILNGNTIQRYDGQRFLTFRYEASNPHSLPTGPIYGMVLDQKDRLWIVYGAFHVGYFNIRNFKFHEVRVNASKELLHKTMGGVFAGSNGDIILVGADKFMFTFNEAADVFDEKYNKFRLPNHIRAFGIFEDRQNQNYWITSQNGLVKYNLRLNTLSYAGNNVDNDPYIKVWGKQETILHFYIDRHKRGWLVSWPIKGMQVMSFDPATKQVKSWEHSIGDVLNNKYYSINGFTELADGSFWIHGENLFARLRYDYSVFDPVPANTTSEYSLRFDNINIVREDREGNVWIGTNLGLYRFNPSAQMVLSVKNRRLFDKIDYQHEVTDVLQTREGDILVATWGAGVFSYDAQFRPTRVEHLYEAHTKLGEGMTWALHQHRNGDIWRTQQGGGIFVWHADTKKTEKIQDPVFENSTIRQVVEDRHGNLWFGTQRGYIVKWEYASKKFSVQQKLQSIIPRLMIDSADVLWACTEANGLYKISTGDGRILHRYYSSDTAGNGLLSGSTSDIIQYDDSTYLVLAEGVNILNAKTHKFRYFRMENGLPTTSISNIIKDRNGYIWMSSEAGVLSYHIPRRKLSVYSADDGVSAYYCNVGSSALLNDGTICFGTSHDVMLFNPDELSGINYKIPRIEITGILLMNKRLNLDSLRQLRTIELGHHENSIVIEFSSLSYQNKYGAYYRMENLEKEWIQADVSRQVTYNYLPPGDYTFKVTSPDQNGKPGEVTEIWFHIKPPFWKSWWFYTFLVIIAATVLLLFDKQRIQRIRKEEEIRTSIAGNLHDEVNTVLQNISVLSEIARIKTDTQPEQSKEYIYEIQQKSRNMVVAMNDVLWSIHPDNDSMSRTIERINEVAQALANKHSASVTVQTDERVKELNLPMKTRHEFILVYKLAIVTLVEELKAPETTVQLDYARGKLHMQIFSLHLQLPRGNNLVTKNINEIKSRAELVDGASVDVQSDEKGTWINFETRI